MPTAKQYSRTIRRHLKLADFLEGVRPDEFDMTQWFSAIDEESDISLDASSVSDLLHLGREVEELPVTDDPTKFLDGLRKGRAELSCGLAACLGGYALMLWPNDVHPYDSIEEAAKRILGDEVYPIGSLFQAGSPWQTPKAAAEQLRRRVSLIAAQMVEDHEAVS